MRWVLMLLLAGCQGFNGAFECGGKALQQVPGSAECDGVVDCWGGQDERDADCATELFYCTESVESQAILASQECDGVLDCADTELASDEAGCSPMTTTTTTTTTPVLLEH